MAIKKYYATADNTISNAFDETFYHQTKRLVPIWELPIF